MCIQEQFVECLYCQRSELIEQAKIARRELRETGCRGWEEVANGEDGGMPRDTGRSGGKPKKMGEIRKELFRRTGW